MWAQSQLLPEYVTVCWFGQVCWSAMMSHLFLSDSHASTAPSALPCVHSSHLHFAAACHNRCPWSFISLLNDMINYLHVRYLLRFSCQSPQSNPTHQMSDPSQPSPAKPSPTQRVSISGRLDLCTAVRVCSGHIYI